SGKELAKELKTNARATELLCNALTSLGFLEKENGLFKNSPRSDRYLVRGRPYFVGDNLRHQSHLWEKWCQ
ncbi:acetylserotonin O-methyltransferase, partial [candidate division KSB1 bacterium]|nr:acetylserotonin O-methyltransferase [candidate division KSB1 bacterium]